MVLRAAPSVVSRRHQAHPKSATARSIAHRRPLGGKPGNRSDVGHHRRKKPVSVASSRKKLIVVAGV